MAIVNNISTVLTVFVSVAYAFQIFYFLLSLLDEGRSRYLVLQAKKKGLPFAEAVDYSLHQDRRFAFVIAARNEELVISHLVQSIRSQNYPGDLIDVYVVADNCTDSTARVAREAGAVVYERFNTDLVGKGYAMDYLFKHIREDKGSWDVYDGYFVFDADNILDKNYINEMNTVFEKSTKHKRIVTGYRNSKNFDTNWITAGYGIAFMREAKYLNHPRTIVKGSCTVSGTGYLVSHEVIEENNGWPYQLLTEDIQLSADYISRGERIAYAKNAVFYDEQPVTLIQSWNQRMRWTKGFYQVIFKYGGALLKNMFKDRSMTLSRYDMFMFLAPSVFFNIATLALSIFAIALNLSDFNAAMAMLPFGVKAVLQGALSYYLINLAQAFFTVVTEWDRILAPNSKKIGYMFTYPIFMFTYIPLSFFALFTRVKWRPIKHTFSTSIDEMERQYGRGRHKIEHEEY